MKKILIANRGEIALRIQRTAKQMGIKTVAIYNEADRNSAFVKQADEAIFLAGDQLSENYLNIERIIAAAKKSGADAIHPGYGFLSENASFVQACERAGIIFIGPGAAAIQAMGDKIQARATATKAGVPVTPGITGSSEELLKKFKDVGLPVLIKAAAGGGGKGMRVVNHESEFQNALEATAREAKSYFGDDAVYIEKYISKPRHIEVQVLGDKHGNVVHLFERECSLQRRHQKIIEEAPSPTLTDAVRAQICNAAVQLAASIGYYSAGTMEFLVDENLNFYFLEMNTRIQVEHPVTELTTGIDIVEQQIRIANGESLPFTQESLIQKGHAIECRIYAEDPEQQFLPSPGLITYYEEPILRQAQDDRQLTNGDSSTLLFEAFSPRTDMLSPLATTRIDGMQLKTGDMISGDFDPMISKLIVWDEDREKARLSMLSALQQYHIKGIKTNINFMTGLLQHHDFINNRISTKYIDEHLDKIINDIKNKKQETGTLIPLIAGLTKSFRIEHIREQNIWQTIGYWRHGKYLDLTVDEQPVTVELIQADYPVLSFILNEAKHEARLSHQAGINYVLSYNNRDYNVSIYEIKTGTYEVTYDGFLFQITRRNVSFVDAETFTVTDASGGSAGNITSPMPGKVIKLNVKEGDAVKKGDVLLIVEAMKMENNILSPVDGVVNEIKIKQGEKVDASTKLVILA